MSKYSVLMSLYRKEKPEFLIQAIDSILSQTLPADEIVIVKDGELTDQLNKILDDYERKYAGLFKIVGYENNRGLGLALNYGLNYCKNDLVARMDTDDISMPFRCEKQVQFMDSNKDIDILGSAVDEFLDDVSNVISRRVVPLTSSEIFDFAKRRSAFNHPTVMYRRNKVLSYGGYRDLRRNQDVDLFGRMLYGGCKAKNFSESLLWFRSDNSLSKRRKSWENTWSYIATIKRFHNMGYSSFSDVVIVSCAQLIMYIMPISVQNYLYKRFLRK